MWIQNVAWADIPTGNHRGDGTNTMLIQIVDPAMEFPVPKHKFVEVHKFEFLDVEGDCKTNDGNGQLIDMTEFAITDFQAAELVESLQYALAKSLNVVVHCHAGICRSGAVAEVGVMMGFEDARAFRAPNLRVKHKMMKVLGWTYDTDEKPQDNWQKYYNYLESKGDI